MKLGNLLAPLFSSSLSSNGPEPVTIDEAMKVSGQDVLVKLVSNNPNSVSFKWNKDAGFTTLHTPKGRRYYFALPGLYDRSIDFEGKTMDQLLCDSEYVIKSGDGIDEWCRKQWEPEPSYLETLWEDRYSYLASLMTRIWPKSPELPTPNYVTVDEMMKGTSEEFMGWLESKDGNFAKLEPNKAVLHMFATSNKDILRSVVDSTNGYYIDTEGKTLSQICCESKYVSKSGDGIDEWCSTYNSEGDSAGGSDEKYLFYSF